MSILIDKFIEISKNRAVEIDKKWYIAKPISYFSYIELPGKIKDAYRVLVGKSIAVHYKEDEK